MSIAGEVFVTPHAVARFRERIRDMPYDHALAAIIRSLASASSVAALPNGTGFRVRTREPYRFRAVVRPPRAPGDAPSVVSILRG